MPKKSRKQRRKENESMELVKAPRRAYTGRRKRVCSHCMINYEGRYYEQSLIQLESGNYKCSICNKIFTKEQKEMLDALCMYLTTPGAKSKDALDKLLIPEIMSNEYYYVSSEKTDIGAIIETTAEDLLNTYESCRHKTKEETLEYLEAGLKNTETDTLLIKDFWEISDRVYITHTFPCFLLTPPWEPDQFPHYPWYTKTELLDILKNSKNPEDAYEKLGMHLAKMRLCDTEKVVGDSILEWLKKEKVQNKPHILQPPFEGIVFREDLFEYLCDKGLECKIAYKLMVQISTENNEINPMNHAHYAELNAAFYDWAEKVEYLPSRKIIFDIFKIKQ